MKKLPSQLSNDELLKYLAERPKEEEREITSEDYYNDVLGFVTFFNIESGEEYITAKKLYRIYKQWSQDPVSIHKFLGTLSTFLPRNTLGLFINKKAIKLSALAHKLFVAKKTRNQLKSPLHLERFNAFLAAYNIKKGDTPIPVCSLHQLFLEWSKKKMGIMMFRAFCKLHFELKKDAKSHRWVKLDKSIFEVFPRERVLSIFESKLREFAQKAKDKKTKKQVPEPGPDSES